MKQLKFIKVQRNQYVDVLNQIAAIHRGINFLRHVKTLHQKIPQAHEFVMLQGMLCFSQKC